jgi:hypothetical protein
MLDPVSAIGLTASIVQLITFSEGLLKRASSIYHSANGSLVQHTELESVALTFSELVDGLHQKKLAFQLARQTAQDERQTTELDLLVLKTRTVVDEILELVTKLRAQESSSRTWSSIRQAFLTIINESRLSDLEQRLNRLKSQVDSCLLASIWYVTFFSPVSRK